MAGDKGLTTKAAGTALKAAGVPAPIAGAVANRAVPAAKKALKIQIGIVVSLILLLVGLAASSSNNTAVDSQVAYPQCPVAPTILGGMIANPAVTGAIYAAYVDPAETVTPKAITADIKQRMLVVLSAAHAAGFRGDKLIVIVSLAGRESTFTPTAFNGNSATGDLSYGLWQINMIGSMGPANRTRFGITTNEQLYDPYVAARAARVLYDASAAIPFFAWGPYKNKAPLFGGAEDWVVPVIAVATEAGYIDTNGLPALPANQPTPQVAAPPDTASADTIAATTTTSLVAAGNQQCVNADGTVGTIGASGIGGPTNGTYAYPIPHDAAAIADVLSTHHDYPASDIGIPVGTPLYAPVTGTVTLTTNTSFQWYEPHGTYCHPSATNLCQLCGVGLHITDANGWEWSICHMSRNDMKTGDTVTAGQQLGLSGNTGHSSGPHLHFGIQSPAGVKTCPQQLLEALYNNTPVPDLNTLPSTGCTH